MAVLEARGVCGGQSERAQGMSHSTKSYSGEDQGVGNFMVELCMHIIEI